MSTLSDLVTLSLLPLSWRRRLGESLRAGRAPHLVLQDLRANGAAAAVATAAGRSGEILDRAAGLGMTAVAWGDAAYPPMLAAIADPPPILWLRGSIDALSPIAVAIVGSRAGSPYAVAVAEQLAADLAARGLAVVSGLARGVDSAAHRGALTSGTTVAVLGSGADVVYPHEHVALAAAIMSAGGAVVSELAPGTPPRKPFFPLRNRIISGLSRAVVIVEAGEKSGSLITARCALDQGRDVLAVPGNILSGRNRGGHSLLRDGARIVESADDVLEEIGLGRVGRRPAPRDPGELDGTSKAIPRDPPQDAVLAALIPGEPSDLDTIAERTGLPPSKLLPRLLMLELGGSVLRAEGGRFIRFDRSC